MSNLNNEEGGESHEKSVSWFFFNYGEKLYQDMSDAVARKMLRMIRESKEEEKSSTKHIVIKSNDKRFGDVRKSQEQQVIKTLDNNVVFEENALLFYPEIMDLTLNGEIPSLNTKFQFRYNDPSGDGCYVWANGLQLTETNTRSVGKLHDAFVNWKHGLIEESDLIEKMKKELTEND